MSVIVLQKNSFNITEIAEVVSIAFDGTTYTITKSDSTTVTYAKADYLINIKW